jgi:excisionase family DNA binding protein
MARLKKYLSVNEMAAFFHVTTRTIHRWEDEGKFAAVRIPGIHKLMIPESVVAAMLKAAK